MTANSGLVAITGYGQASDRELDLAAAFDHHLVKRIDTKKLYPILRRNQRPLPWFANTRQARMLRNNA